MREEQQKIDPNTQLIIFAPAICTSWIDWGTYGDTNYYKFDSAIDWLIKKCVDFEQDKKKNPKGYKLIDVLSFHIYIQDLGSIGKIRRILFHKDCQRC